jgi:hypothetical protein
MPNINISIDTSDLRKADVWLATMSGQMPFVASRAISATAKSIHTNLKGRLASGAVTKPTNWTTRGLMVRYSTRANPTAVVGFNYGDGSFSPTGARDSSMGVPSGRYMDVLARGGTRSAKASELAIRRKFPEYYRKFLAPAGYGIGKTNSFGNVSGGNYQRLLSQLGANRDQGVTSNAPKGGGSRGRTAAKQREISIFLDRRKGGAIMQRTGRGPKGGTGFGSGRPGRPQTVGYRRGIKPAFWLVNQPNYKVQFPVRSIAERQFKAEITRHFAEALADAQRNPRIR